VDRQVLSFARIGISAYRLPGMNSLLILGRLRVKETTPGKGVGVAGVRVIR
jgi:hypothetical protein